MKQIPLLTAVFILVFAAGLTAASAVYFCNITNAIGFKYGCESADIAKESASLFCINNGGKNPLCIDSSENGGFGVVMWADDTGNKRWCTTVLGALSDAKAMQQASEELARVGAAANIGHNRFYDPKK